MRLRLWISVTVIAMVLSLQCFALTDNLESAVSSIEQMISFENISDMLSANLIKSFQSIAVSFSVCFSVIITGTVFSAMKDSFSHNQDTFDFISSCILVLSCSLSVSVCFSKTAEHLEAICSLMLSFVPTMIFLLTSTGSTLSSAFTSASVPFTVSTLETVSVSVILPLIKAVCAITSVNAISKKANLSGMCNFLKSVCLWITGLSFTLFTGILSLGSLLQSGMDNLTMKGLKYGAARLIPIAGGMISESMKTVISSVCAIKSVTGISGIIIIIYTVVPPLLTILCTKLCFSLLSSLAKGTNQNRQSSYLDSLSSVMSLLLSLILGCSAAFIIMFSIFIKTGVTA